MYNKKYNNMYEYRCRETCEDTAKDMPKDSHHDTHTDRVKPRYLFSRQKQQGFTLIEIVIVIIILGVLAAVALPRFISATRDAEDVSIEAVASAFASAVSLARSQWELNGRPLGQVELEGTLIAIGENGYPSGGGLPQAMTAQQCLLVLDGIMQSPPRATTSTNLDDIRRARLFVRVDTQLFAPDHACTFYQTSGLTVAPNSQNNVNGFVYVPATGRINTFINKN